MTVSTTHIAPMVHQIDGVAVVGVDAAMDDARRSHGMVSQVMVKIINAPVKTLICRAGKSPTSGARNNVRSVPWIDSARMISSHTARARLMIGKLGRGM